ncbi:alpha/beta hydrolase [Dactylosporangium sp. AC04546]|uniref:alpha/beta fold hydrolase n=1 Tax=Dactylosporangium sp. AC04546 TaxID=2862460 RepID=UPI001EE00FAB|nr:alpha/beta hydrolase [Dactylosporangium sp. AC04546]WVK82625.1 alpha/beta hydrolase [Dactylosporangium sp. AC04546]
MRAEKIAAGMTVHSVGQGPGIVVLHGGGITQRDYHRLANALADRFTVHLYNRRGRIDSRPLDGTETAQTDLDDLAAVLEHTGARAVFGHSGGGFVALRAGIAGLPLDRIAVYDPGLSIDGNPPFEFVADVERRIEAGDTVGAMTAIARGADPDGPGGRLPMPVARFATRLFLATPIGKGMAELLPATGPEIRRIADHNGPASDYAGIQAEVLLAAGARSARSFTEHCEALAAAVPRGRAVVIPGSSHNAANVARPAFVAPFAEFFANGLVERVDGMESGEGHRAMGG